MGPAVAIAVLDGLSEVDAPVVGGAARLEEIHGGDLRIRFQQHSDSAGPLRGLAAAASLLPLHTDVLAVWI